MKRLSADDRRAEILDAAADQIAKRGLASVRVEDVAKACGVSRALVFYHFETKDSLVAQAFERAASVDLDELARAVGGARTATGALARVLRHYEPTGGSASWRLWIDAWAAAIHEPEIRAASRRLDKAWKKALSDVIEQGVADGEFECADPSGAAWRITGLLDGLTVQAQVNRHGPDRATRSRWVREAAASEVGISARALR
jgi:AcrR family transcriptional regulator